MHTYILLSGDYDKAAAPYGGLFGRLFLWTTPQYFTPIKEGKWRLQRYFLEQQAGSMEKVVVAPQAAAKIAVV